MRRALRVVLASPALPPTVVTASTSSSGEAQASRIASASSWPGSQSRMTGRERAGWRSARQRGERRGPLRVGRDHAAQAAASRSYGWPSAAGGMLRPTTPARMTIVRRYGSASQSWAGTRAMIVAEVARRAARS